MKTRKNLFLTDAKLKNEIEKCEYCSEKPCKEACPADCSPADFIMAAKTGEKSDYKRAAALIMGNNPFGGTCGAVCPDWHCMKACVHNTFDSPLNIPAIQAAIILKAKELGVMPEFEKPGPNGKKAAIVGGGPAGCAAASVLARKGFKVDIYEERKSPGGMCNIIPDARLDRGMLNTDTDFVKSLGDISIKTGKRVKKPSDFLKKGYDSVIVASGLDKPMKLHIPGEELAIEGLTYLRNPSGYPVKGKSVAVAGGGAVAADCAATAKRLGAEKVEIFTRKNTGAILLPKKELEELLKSGVNINGCTRLTAILKKGGKAIGVKTVKISSAKGKTSPRDIPGTQQQRKDFDTVITAIKCDPAFKPDGTKGVFFAGETASTIVEAVAAGKNAALEAAAFMTGKTRPAIESKIKSRHVLDGRKTLPVPVEADFFGRKIKSPFLLSAAPHTDGYEQMKKAYEAGWAGGVMKTAFDGIHIHIPSEYMVAYTQSTYGNCDNVSGHPLDRVCAEVKKLVKEFPDRLTMASTGGSVTGNDETDKRVWQSNTRKLEAAGATGIEYSLSCPQGGDGTKGDIVSQDPELTAKIIDWVMEISDPEIPKLFKLTAAVTSIYPVIAAIKEVFAKYPGKKAGVTLANSFPTMAFRKGGKKNWEEGVVIGMSGEGVTPISNLTLANVSKLGVTVSGNGGPMDYKSAANFLALGAKTVQFCTIVMKYGYGIIDELDSGLSCLMEERGIKSVSGLIGRALPDPITSFGELSAVKKVSAVRAELCEHCGNCTRCPYLAITLDEKTVPVIEPPKCIGCSICVQKCFSGALYMRERTKEEIRGEGLG